MLIMLTACEQIITTFDVREDNKINVLMLTGLAYACKQIITVFDVHVHNKINVF